MVMVLGATLVSGGAAAPISASVPEEYCVNWMVPDMHPGPRVERHLAEVKAQKGVTLTSTKIGKRVCFATEQLREQWMQGDNSREYEKWLQRQSEYQEYMRTR